MSNWKDLAINALNVQNAANLSGIIHSFYNDITKVRELLKSEGITDTNSINQHHICVLYCAQIMFLTCGGIYPNDLQYCKAYSWACDKKNSRGI
jgi:hypothetical protein